MIDENLFTTESFILSIHSGRPIFNDIWQNPFVAVIVVISYIIVNCININCFGFLPRSQWWT